ncbi:hypothetical protein [Paludisphaera mucosa]|uniref:Carboxypeptidase regulatory-like domain-containing protein n=1 Tax=Paludisphaera mucosa TaxID=3030827 RepID=A0ABT6FKG5_9BACT|nr:hypothetical protein [Paludisphaera mucosa]MDG3007991.1 hypothetical protein [Paludisphaera mucosa]
MSRRTCKALAATASLAACLLSAGCETSAPAVSGSTAEVTVRGTVKIHGRPAGGGEILFDPSNVKRKFAPIRSAAIGPDGAYTVTTLYGENKISIRSREIAAPTDAPAAEGKSLDKAVAKSAAVKAAVRAGDGMRLRPNVKRTFIESGERPIDVEL